MEPSSQKKEEKGGRGEKTQRNLENNRNTNCSAFLATIQLIVSHGAREECSWGVLRGNSVGSVIKFREHKKEKRNLE